MGNRNGETDMAVIPIVALASVAMAFLLFLAYLVWWQAGDEDEINDLSPVDLEAFRNLTDPQEVQFLRANLPPKEFKRIQRIRMQAASLYISVISRNAANLVVIGRSVRTHSDAEVAAAGLDVVNRALQLKLWCTLALLKVNATKLCPTLLSPSTRIAERYLDVTSLTSFLPKKLAA
jgi:hypothetical protein